MYFRLVNNLHYSIMKILKRIFLGILALLLLGGLYFVYGLYINPKSPLGSAHYEKENQTIDIRYYRPYKNDRLIFGDKNENALVPFGLYWRLGANLTTKLTATSDFTFAGRSLPAGSYGLYTYPYAENWVMVVHRNSGGFSAAEPDSEGIVMKVNVPVQTLDSPVEQFTIDFVDHYLRMRWDTTQVVIPIE